MKKIISIILCSFILSAMLIVVYPVAAKAEVETDSRVYPEAPLLLETVDARYYDFALSAEIENLALYVNDKTVNLAVLNKKTGTIWSSEVREESVNTGKEDGARFRSLFFEQTSSAFEGTGSLSEVYCGSLLDETVIAAYGSGADAQYDYISIDYASVPNGIRVKAHFYNKRHTSGAAVGDICIVDFYLDSESQTFKVTTNTDLLNYAGSDSVWVALDILPFFMSAVDTDEGYIFFPDGSGTIAEFTPNHSEHESIKRLHFYSGQVPNVTSLKSNEEDGVMPIMYPVLGIRRNGEAVFAILTEGIEQSALIFAPSGAIANINRVYFEFFLNELLVNLDGTYRYDGHSIPDTSFTVEYHFLDEDKSDYAGMANEYRSYLLENDLLKDTISADDKMPLALDFYMNTSTTNIFGEQAIIMTTFDEVGQAVSGFHEDGVEDMLINISSWQQYGDSTDKVIPVYSRIGGMSGLKSVIEKVKEFGYDLFMQVNMQFAVSSTTKFKTTRDAIQNLSGTVLKTGGYYLVAPQAILDRYEEIYYEYFKDSGISGLNFEQLGYYIYNFNYEEEHYNKFDCSELFQKVLEGAQSDFGKSAIWYGNQYSLKYANWIYDLPTTDTGYANTTREVPFAQIVLHGYIPYSSIPGNTFYDDKLQTLKWIEYGYIPYYKLTYASTSELAETDMAVLFSAQYSDWAESVVEKYQKMSSNFGFLYNQEIVGHDKVIENVFVTEYADGTKIYVNYTSTAAYTSDGVVNAEDFLLVKGKG